MKEVLKEIPKCLLANLATPSFHPVPNCDSQRKSPSATVHHLLLANLTARVRGKGSGWKRNSPLTLGRSLWLEQKTGPGRAQVGTETPL